MKETTPDGPGGGEMGGSGETISLDQKGETLDFERSTGASLCQGSVRAGKVVPSLTRPEDLPYAHDACLWMQLALGTFATRACHCREISFCNILFRFKQSSVL